MTRGGLLEQKVCRQILESAVERSDIRHARGETESSVAIMEAVLEGQADAAYATAAVCKGFLESGAPREQLPDIVPARVFVILNSGLAAGLANETAAAADKRELYRNTIRLALKLLQPETLIGAEQNSAIATIRDRLDSYREAVDLGRLTLRQRGLPDSVWRGNRDVFAPGRGDLGKAKPRP